MKYQLIIKDLETGKQYGTQVEVAGWLLEKYGTMTGMYTDDLLMETSSNIYDVHRLFLEDKYGP